MLVALLCLALAAAACTTDSEGGDDPDVTGGGGEEADGNAEGDSDGPPATSPGGGDPEFGGILRYGIEAEVDGLNPTVNRFAASGRIMGTAVYDALSRSNADGVAEAYLAESFTPNADFTRWEMKVREGITFHDGAVLDADAVITGLESTLGDPLISLAVKPNLEADNEVEKVDEMTVAFNASLPTANFPELLTGQLGMVPSPDWIAATKDDAALNQEPVGTGPFMFEDRLQDSKTSFVKNPDYWAGEVYLDGVEFRPITQETARRQALQGGDIDIMHTTDAATIKELREDSNFVTNVDDTGEETFVQFNTAAPPFDDQRARAALSWATNRETYVAIVGQDVRIPANSYFHPDTPWHNPDLVQPTDDPDQAEMLVAEFCAEKADQCNNGKIVMTFGYSAPSAANDLAADTLINGAWDRFFEVERQEVRQADFITQVALGQYQAVLYRLFGGQDPDLDRIWIDCDTIDAISLNWARYCNPDVQELLEFQRGSEDRAARVEAWQEIAQIYNEDFVYLFLTHTPWAVIHSTSVHAVTQGLMADGTSPSKPFDLSIHPFNQIWMDQ